MAQLFGPTSANLPADWESFAAYNAAMMQSDALSVSAAAREVAGQIFAGGRPCLRLPRWYRALSAKLLPDRLRLGFGFAFDERDRKAAESALARIRRVYPKVPTRLRHVGPYQEAQARLQGKSQPGWATRCLNRGLDRPARAG
jgi:uncharacterized protein (DUF2236 family)